MAMPLIIISLIHSHTLVLALHATKDESTWAQRPALGDTPKTHLHAHRPATDSATFLHTRSSYDTLSSLSYKLLFSVIKR